MCFSWKAKIHLLQTFEKTPVHSPDPLLQYPPNVLRSQILILGVYSRVAVTHLERYSPFEDLWSVGLHAGIPAKALKNIKPILQGQTCSLIRTILLSRRALMKKDTFYANFLFKHLSTLTNNILQKGTCSLS